MKSYLIIFKLKTIKQEVLLRAPILNKDIKYTVIDFIDDASFYTNGKNYQNKIQLIVEEYNILYKAIGGKVE